MSKVKIQHTNGWDSKIVDTDELAQYKRDNNWMIIGPVDDSTSKNVDKTKEEKRMAEEAAKAFDRRAKYSHSQAFEELASDVREEHGLEEPDTGDWDSDTSWNEYKQEKRQAIKEELNESQDPSPTNESKSNKLERLKSAKQAWEARGKASDSANTWGDIADELQEEIEELESNGVTTSELSSGSGEKVETYDNGQTTVVKRIDGSAKISSSKQEVREELQSVLIYGEGARQISDTDGTLTVEIDDPQKVIN
ncbi:hypothetical protein SAMN06266787_10697 [Halorubrum ezzemoulense]|uniref:Uncharacterized protein n=1 Tax=Halorubrum ezzemoulense TaxID=337243 RepID=A0A238XRG2_HALEZ|nr:hypothetical protein [Halorubrum ezzemoulense]SNR61626.1 hypothetical protein SAMN06266787_10697 [Halorubrum ezzemoulense]